MRIDCRIATDEDQFEYFRIVAPTYADSDFFVWAVAEQQIGVGVGFNNHTTLEVMICGIKKFVNICGMRNSHSMIGQHTIFVVFSELVHQTIQIDNSGPVIQQVIHGFTNQFGRRQFVLEVEGTTLTYNSNK